LFDLTSKLQSTNCS